MSGRDGGYLLPAVLDPARVCLQLYIPDDDNHRRAFWGALESLARWDSWQRDELKQGREAAGVWKDVIRAARQLNEGGLACMAITDIRITDCVVEVEHDNSGVYIPIGSLAACAPPQTRVRIDDCTLQESLDGGESWQDRGEIDCGGGGGGASTQLQVVDCQVQTSTDDGGSWSDVPGAHFYPISASCPAIAFWARSSLPYLLGMDDTTDANLFRLGLVPSGDVSLMSYGRRLSVQYGLDFWRSLWFETDGLAGLDNVAADGSSRNGFLWETNGDYYLQRSIYFRDYGDTSSNVQVAALRAQRANPTSEDFRGEVGLYVNDYIGQKTLISGGTDGTLPKLGVLGALPVVRQTVAGDCLGNEALKSMLEAFHSFGWIEDETTLGVPPDPNPNDTAFKEAFRCRVAAGAIDFLIEMYSEAINICCDEGIISFQEKVDSVNGRMIYLQTNSTEPIAGEDDFWSWVQLVTNTNQDCDLAYSCLSAVLDARQELQQLYYCSLNEKGLLTPNGYDEWIEDLLTGTSMPTAEAEALQLFCSYFKLPSWAMINSHGYFYSDPDDCTFGSCEELENWSMNWHWSLNAGDPAWQFENGTYESFQGWRQTSISSALVMTIQNSISGFMMHFDANTGDQVQVVVIDRATGSPLAIEGGVAGVGDFEISWQAANESEWAVNGVDVRLTSADLTDFDGFTGARVIHSCMSGWGLTPAGGEVVGSCI